MLPCGKAQSVIGLDATLSPLHGNRPQAATHKHGKQLALHGSVGVHMLAKHSPRRQSWPTRLFFSAKFIYKH